ncbi:RloB family protein [Streptomyces radicis]|uniref:RloB domain-containing protein n=1 Tax=Streptomyces radicis TaxID=1750517 RepID=A0A3A9WQV2_9ACTN|nr:RloB family protein [Streptomyces radicis]RKN10136.1 RloB domain-containing protein [Streptomyces radicis]RKN24478.1 RloB domain-containing protein [Streptomyces radicis]
MARTKGRESPGRAKPKRDQRRRVVYVFTEGEVTEPGYIEVIRERAVYADPAVRVDVHIANASAPTSQRKPLTLVEAAARLMRREAREAKRMGVKKEFWPQVWCLFDRDEHQSVDTALKNAKDADVRVAFSHPCFEVWRLLHHKDVTGTFGGVCGEATKRLPFAKSTAKIKAVLPEQIPRDSFTHARKRALKLNAAHGDHLPKSLRDPYTDVYEFVEDGLGIASY